MIVICLLSSQLKDSLFDLVFKCEIVAMFHIKPAVIDDFWLQKLHFSVINYKLRFACFIRETN